MFNDPIESIQHRRVKKIATSSKPLDRVISSEFTFPSVPQQSVNRDYLPLAFSKD
jgi:hypothetical protein